MRKESVTKATRKRLTAENQKAFLDSCVTFGLPQPVPEFQFYLSRKWRFDFCWIKPPMLAVEIQGGLFSRGRHTRGKALLREYEKLNAAAALGYRVIFVTPQQVENGKAFEIIRSVMRGDPCG